MKPLLVAAALIVASPELTWSPVLPSLWSGLHPRAYVERAARNVGVPVPLAFAVWWLEADASATAPDGVAGERGPFQCMKRTARAMGFDWERQREFRQSVGCGLLFLRQSLEACDGNWIHAAHRYNRGECPGSGKPWTRALDIGNLLLRINDGNPPWK